MDPYLPKWCETLLSLKEEAKTEKSYYFDLNELAFERLKECRTNTVGTIGFKNIRLKLCRSLSINKKQCMDLLKYFEAIGKIEFVRQKGVRIRDSCMKAR